MERLEPKDVAALAKVRANRMKQSDVCDAFKDKVVDQPDGKYTIDIKDSRADVLKLREMNRPYARAASEFSAEMSARQATIAVRNPLGTVVKIAAHSEREAAAKGFLPTAIWSPVRKFAACPRRYFPCGHYTETAGETVCSWCRES